MTAFAIWAPGAGSVDVVIDGAPHRLATDPQRRGWWAADLDAPAGSDYAFSIDGASPIPDPRSLSQPGGVFGPSRVVDHAAFPWTDTDWRGADLREAVLYELHVGTFSPEGTFAGVAERLDHLVDLGVDAIELMPVAEFPGSRGWGYDGVDLYAPHHAYGGPEGLKALVDACHGRGVAVVLDVVYNHLGPSGNHLPQVGPYFTDRYRTPWGDALNFDGADSDEVRSFFLDNACMWLREYHLDGLRLDAVHAIVDTSATHLLEALAERVGALAENVRRPLWLIAESDLNDPRVVRRPEAGGYGMDAQWSDDFHHALHSVLTGERSGYYEDFGELSHLAVAIQRAFVYAGEYSRHRRRRHGRHDPSLPLWRFLAYSQNHDQIGNRATGERASMLMSPGRLKIAAALVLAGPFVPMLFQGEEWASSSPFQYFTDHPDPDLGRAVSEGRRREFAAFGWSPDDVPDPQSPSTFERSRLDWAAIAEPFHAEMLAWYRTLIGLRRRRPALGAGGAPAVAYDDAEGWLTMARADTTVVAHLGAEPHGFALGAEPHRFALGGTVLARSSDAVRVDGGTLMMPPDSVAILGSVPEG